jgi:lysophospholipase L1-like esterase
MKSFNRRSLFVSTLSAGIAASAFADEQCGERPNTAPALQPPLLLTDWPWLARYRDDNAKLIASGVKVDTVFLGDSITEGWVRADAEFFAKGNVGRGISAQTTPQLLVRMHADVIALKPRTVHIMAGTNDIAHNTGPMTAQDSQANLMAMCEIAKAHKLRIVLGSVPPASKYWWRPEAQPKPAALAMNEWLRAYAKQIRAKYADYAAVLTDASGNVKLELAKDEVHPTPAGYAAMRAVAEAAIRS